MPSYKICSITASDAAASYTGGVLKRQPKVLNMKRRLVLLLVELPGHDGTRFVKDELSGEI